MLYDFDEIIDRSGTNSVSDEGWKALKLRSVADSEFVYPHKEMIRMWIADMEFATPAPILDAVRQRLDKRILGYSLIYDRDYYDTLTAWFADRYNWVIDRADLVTTPGIVSALTRLVPMLSASDESVLFCTPSYSPFQRAGEINGRRVLTSSLLYGEGRFSMDMEDLEAKVSDPENKIKVFILCNPHNPTGRVWTAEELREVADLCFKHDVWIIADEVHCDLLRVGGEHTPLMRLYPNEHRIVACISPSKTFNMAGNLLAHVVIRDQGVKREWMQHYGEVLSPLSIAAVQGAYGKGGAWLDELKVYLDTNFRLLQSKLAQQLPLAKFVVPEATYLAWVDLSAYTNRLPKGHDFGTFLATKAGVVVEDGKGFVDDGEGYVRLNVACPRSVLEMAVDRIAGALERAEMA